jgi:hypothetical protein
MVRSKRKIMKRLWILSYVMAKISSRELCDHLLVAAASADLSVRSLRTANLKYSSLVWEAA